MSTERRYFLFWLAAWLLLVLTSILTRTLLPVDETRYVGVAWEMWDHGNLIVPIDNGEPYSHKPPLLFWLINLGWWIFGVNDWWPRLLPALFSLASVYLTRQLAQILWPDRPRVALLAPTILMGTTLWLLFTPVVMFDMLLTFWVLLAVRGLLTAALENYERGLEVVALSIGMGILTKGPVMLVHVVPLAVLFPYFVTKLRNNPWRWYGAIFLCILTGVAFVLVWAIPAAIYGGEAYARAIFWGQSAGRIVDSFAHKHPWWWYLELLPVILFPWILWPNFWRRIRAARQGGSDLGLKCCVVWLSTTFAIFMMISGKQLHYLLPLVPAFALVVARALEEKELPATGRGQWPVSVVFLLLGVLVVVAPQLPVSNEWPHWVRQALPRIGAVWLLAGVLVTLPWRAQGLERRVLHMSAVMIVSFGILKVIAYGYGSSYYDVRELSKYIKQEQNAGHDIVNIGKYYDQFHFYGRLNRSITQLGETQAVIWAQFHPDGSVIAYYDRKPSVNETPVYQAPYRGHWVAVWPGVLVARHPELLSGG